MGPITYIRSSWPYLNAGFGAASLVGGVVAVGGGGADLSLLAAGIVLASTAVALGIDYARRAPFWRDLDALASSAVRDGSRDADDPRDPVDVSDALWITQMVEQPDFAEGRVAWDVLRLISKAASDRVAAADRRVAEYREYVETWVHEVKTPLAAGHLATENLRAEIEAARAAGLVEADADRLLGRARTLDGELDRAEDLVEQSLFYARSETLDRDYLIRSYRLQDLVSASVKEDARLLIGSHVAPRMGKGLDLEVFTDEKWMRFILGQAIQNTVKHARAEGAEISFAGELADEGTAEERVVLTVADNGCGVPAADLPRVFDRGFTGEVGRTGKRATGIGLYLVKRLCDKMGVGVSADSVEGGGFTLRFEFSTNKFRYFEG